jgi:quercetin dioxygenase-like cupin family protein
MGEQARGFMLGPGEGREAKFGPNRLAVKVGPESGGQVGVFESTFPPGAGAFDHRHRSYEEAFYVLEGEIEYRLDEQRVVAAAGACVYVPPGVAHGFRNVGPGHARHLVIHSPTRALEMVEELGRTPPERHAEVLAKYDSELVGS